MPAGPAAGRPKEGPAAGLRTAGRAVALLAGLAVLAEIGYPLVHGRVRAVLTVAAVLAFCAASVGHALVTCGWRVGAALLGAFALGGWLVEAVGVATGVPFGRYSYSGRLGPALLGVPLVVGLAWCMMAWPAYVAAARLLGGSRLTGRPRSAARVLLAAVGLAGWDLFLDPQMTGEGYWTWQRSGPALPGVPGVPLSNYAGWLLAAVLLMTAFEALAGRAAARLGRVSAVPVDAGGDPGGDPAGRRRSRYRCCIGCCIGGDDNAAGRRLGCRRLGAWPRRQGLLSHALTPDAVPVALYLWTYGSSVLAHAAFFGRLGSAAWGALGMGLVAVPLAATLRR